jgi:hypothetical protein
LASQSHTELLLLKVLALFTLPVIPALKKLRQEDHKFESSLGYIDRPVSNASMQHSPSSQKCYVANVQNNPRSGTTVMPRS